jgi:hypothetical protein
MSLEAQGEDLRKAVKWVSEMRKYEPERVLKEVLEEACRKFDLSPMDAEFLVRFVKEDREEVQA